MVACGGESVSHPSTANGSAELAGASGGPVNASGGLASLLAGGATNAESAAAGASAGTNAGGASGTERGGDAGAGGRASRGALTTSDGPKPDIFLTSDPVTNTVFSQESVHRIDLSLPEQAWATLLATAADKVYTEAAAQIDGESIGSIGLRFKGFYSLDSCFENGKLTCDTLSMKLKFDEYNVDQRYHGLKDVHLNSAKGDESLVRSGLAYGLYRDMGIPAPRTGWAVVTVNGASQGLFTLIEDIDGRFTKSHFEMGDGNLFKEAWPDATGAGSYTSALKTNKETASPALFQKFAGDMKAASDADRVAALGRWMDLDYFARYMAVDTAIGNWDGVTTFYCGDWGCSNHNYFMYQEETDPRFWIIPWDMNGTFSTTHWLGAVPAWDALSADCSTRIPTDSKTNSTLPASCDPTLRAVAQNRALYQSKVTELLQKYFIEDRLKSQIDAAARVLAPVVATDPFLTTAKWQGSLGWLKSNLPGLRARLEQVAKAK